MTTGTGLYIVLVSIHGLIRGHDLELGRDADTGGQITYVVELARALIAHPDVQKVDVLTRRVIDPKIHHDYGEPFEDVAPGATIVRLPCGPRRYLRKEVLWPYLDSFIDHALQHVRRVGRIPDLIHSHYADAGYVGARLAGLLGIPLIHTGHSLGRVKRKRLIEQGMKRSIIESHYSMNQRIEAEETVLDSAARVIASTRQEVDEQYSLYDNYQPRRMRVIPPGIDLSRFHPPARGEPAPPIRMVLERFLHDPDKPMILALSRPDERKNIATLIKAYAENTALRELANLVLVLGNRDDISGLERGPREVLTDLLLLVDRYDLYGSIAFPKHHDAQDVPDLYRFAAKTHGIFVNPALTEPFGLTLVEASASGLPIIATEDGGPRDIIGYCKNGLLINPLDAQRMGEAILEVLTNRERWRRWSKSGVRGAHQYFSWSSHVRRYLTSVHKVIERSVRTASTFKGRLPTVDRMLVCDIDNTLLGDPAALKELLERVRHVNGNVGFGVASGRRIETLLRALKEWDIPLPYLFISSVGSEIHYGPRIIEDSGWQKHIHYRWKPEALRAAISSLPGIRLQAQESQRKYKISYYINPYSAPSLREIKRHLRKQDLHANVIYSHQRYLDLLPIRASKGLALRYIALKWGIPLERFLVAGDSGNDEEMLSGNTLGVVVGNYSPELERLRGKPRIYFAQGHYAWGVIEGIEHYNFLGEVSIPNEEL